MANLLHTDDSGQGKAALFIRVAVYYSCPKKNPRLSEDEGWDREQF